MKKVSIIIPVYNAEKYLEECLSSVLAQTYQDFEVLCVNDGSPDNCQKILEEYAKKDNRIRILVQENQGLSGARNTGLDNAKGEYVFFLDADDIIPEYTLETLLKITESTKAQIVASESVKKVQKNPLLNYQIFHNPLMAFVKNKHIFSSACNKLSRADILKTHRFIKGIYFEDWPFLTTLFGRIDSFATTKIPCYYYREEGASITRSTFTRKKVDSYLTGIHFVNDFYQKRPDLLLAQKRMAVAIKMMVNKVYKTKDKELIHYTLISLNDLFEKGIIKKHQLPIKTLFRLWKMRYMK